MKGNVFFILVIFMLTISVGVFAQNPQELRVNSFVNGNLRIGEEIWYSIRPAQSGFLTVETNNTNFDTYLEAFDAQRNLITYNDDYNGTASLIRMLVQANTTYLFRLTGYGGYNAGSFRIMATLDLISEIRPGGAALTSNIYHGDEVWYSVRTTQAGFLFVETSAAIDTTLEAFDGDLNSLFYDDDGAGYPNARLRINVTPGMTFYIKVGLIGDGGSFQISARHEPFPSAVPLPIGSLISGNISSGRELWYSVTVSGIGYLTVETTGNTETYMEILDDNYNFITRDYDGLKYPNSSVRVNALPGKTYIVRLTGNGGQFRILANLEPYPTPVVLNVNSFQNGNISPGGEYWFSVRTTGRGVLIVETEGNTDTFLEAYDSSYNFLTFNDDYWDEDEYSNRNGLNARISLDVQANQTYFFKLRGYSSSVTGPFRILAYINNF